MNTVKVRYVGLKDKETDRKAGTGLTWVGKGAVHDVPVEAWPKLAKHPDVWELVEQKGEVASSFAGLSDAVAPSSSAEAPADDPMPPAVKKPRRAKAVEVE